MRKKGEFKMGNIIPRKVRLQLWRMVRSVENTERTLAAEAEALKVMEELKHEAKAALDERVARGQLFVKYYVQAGARIFTCYASSNGKALAYAIKRSGGKCYCRIISFKIVSKKDYLKERLMMRLSSPASVRKGMTVERFLEKFPELIKGKRLYAFRSFKNNFLFVNSIKECTNYYAARAVARNREDVEFFFDELSFYMDRICGSGPYVSYRLRQLNISTTEELAEADFYSAKSFEGFAMEAKRAELISIIRDKEIRHDGVEGCFNTLSKQPENIEEFTPEKLVAILATFNKSDIKYVKELLKVNNGNLPQYVIWGILTKYSGLRVMKYSKNLGKTPMEAFHIAEYGVFHAMREYRCDNVENVPRKILSELYRTGKNLKEYLKVSSALYCPYYVDYTVYKFLVDNQNSDSLWEKRTVHLFGCKTVEFNYVGIAKYAKPNEIKKSINKTFDGILKRLLSESHGYVSFPKLTIDNHYNGISPLDSEEKIKQAANVLCNCMERCYLAPAKDGSTFLFFAKLEEEVAGFEVYDGKLAQLYGVSNSAVSNEMKEFVASFIRNNPIMVEETIKYKERADVANKWFEDRHLFVEKRRVIVSKRRDILLRF